MLRKQWISSLAGAAWLFIFCGGALAAAPVSVKNFFSGNQYSDPQLSPNGRFLAVIGPDPADPDRRLVDVFDLKSLKLFESLRPTNSYRRSNKEIPMQLYWGSNRLLIFSTGYYTGGFNGLTAMGQVHAVDILANNRADGYGDWVTTNYQILRVRPNQHYPLVAAFYPANHPIRGIKMRFPKGYGNGVHDVVTSPFENGYLMTDHEGGAWLAIGFDRFSGAPKWQFKAKDSNKWMALPAHLLSQRRTGPVGFGPDGTRLYVEEYGDSGAHTLGLYLYDPLSGKTKCVFADKANDIDGLIYSADGKRIVAAEVMDGRPRIAVFDPDDPTIRILKWFARDFPGYTARVVSWTEDRSRAVVEVYGDRNPGTYYLVDLARKHRELLFRRMPGINPQDMASVQPISFSARDGTTIHGYLTLPDDPKSAPPPPLILYVHDGPDSARDRWTFDSMTQLLASRGFAVLQVNYRGSPGYGWSFLKAGFRHWGTVAQSDLIDAVHWAVRQKIADPHRLCIFGHGFGGYSAIRSAELAPDLFRCAVSYDGIYDLAAYAKGVGATWFNNGSFYTHSNMRGRRHIRRILGDDASSLAHQSPINHASDLKAAVFLIHGGRDWRSPSHQVDEMKAALKRAGKPYEYLYKASEGYGFFRVSDQRELATKLIAFFDRNIGSGFTAAATTGPLAHH